MTAQIVLTSDESEALAALAARSGKSSDALLHEAVSQFLATKGRHDFLPLLRMARGIWRDREDLPDFASLRDEWNRS